MAEAQKLDSGLSGLSPTLQRDTLTKIQWQRLSMKDFLAVCREGIALESNSDGGGSKVGLGLFGLSPTLQRDTLTKIQVLSFSCSLL